MFAEKNSQHNKPHLHAKFGEYEILVDLESNVIEGHFPKGKMDLLLTWMEIHRDELKANWELLSSGEPAFKIEPLK